VSSNLKSEIPTKDDVEAIKEYEADKKKKKLVLVPLKDLAKETHSFLD
jgi:hypothetical protein